MCVVELICICCQIINSCLSDYFIYFVEMTFLDLLSVYNKKALLKKPRHFAKTLCVTL